MIYQCLKCERVYSKDQLIRAKTMETRTCIHLRLLCPLCNESDFELQKEIYLNSSPCLEWVNKIKKEE